MSEETEGPGSGPEGASAGVDPVAVALALYFVGKRNEAKAQFARAAALDLTPAEKAELQKVAHG